MRLALAQINPTIGAIEANTALMRTWLDRAVDAGADLVAFPELCVCGYPPRDLLLEESFVDACVRAGRDFGEGAPKGVTIVFGSPLPTERGGVANSVLAYRDGERVARHDKRLLPTYDVFDEDRYFTAGAEAVVFDALTSDGGSRRVGLAICEDLWKGEDAGFASRYRSAPDPMGELADAGAELVLAPSASPFVLGKGLRHHAILRAHAERLGIAVAGVNQVGGNDELIFDGHAAVYDPTGRLIGAGGGFDEALTVVDLGADLGRSLEPVSDPRVEASAEALVFRALTLGVRDYLRKTGFSKAIIGLSGGIDSAVTAAVAVAALGAEHVLGVSMPGRYSSEGSKSDAFDLAERMGVRCVSVPIGPAFGGFAQPIDSVFDELGERRLGAERPDITEENLQSRARGTIVMTLANRLHAIVLTTGNKSELAVGYCTLYGDMNGGLAVLSDTPKRMVYALARRLNEQPGAFGFERAPIPEATITKPPSAELAPDQKDSDSLPPYDVLDEVIERRVERRQSVQTIVAETGFDADSVARLARLLDVNEYKRRQAATGLKVTSVAFGMGRRMPIARGWWRHPSA
ncbi:MAG: NAD+ synthase [Planctomycetota bacterium]